MMRIAEYSDLILSHDKLPVFKMDKVGRAAIESFMKWFNNVGRRLLKALLSTPSSSVMDSLLSQNNLC